MNKESTKQKFSQRWWTLLLVGMIIYLASFCAEGAFRFTDTFHGVTTQFFSAVLLLPFVVVPQSLLILFFWITRSIPIIQRWRTMIVLSPSLIIAGLMLFGLIAEPPTATGRFEKMIVSPIPDSVSNLKSFHGGGGLDADLYVVYFDVDPADFNAILRSHSFTLSKHNEDHWFREAFANIFPSSFDLESKDGRELYVARDRTKWTYAYLVTDKYHKRVYFFAGRV